MQFASFDARVWECLFTGLPELTLFRASFSLETAVTESAPIGSVVGGVSKVYVGCNKVGFVEEIG